VEVADEMLLGSLRAAPCNVMQRLAATYMGDYLVYFAECQRTCIVQYTKG
jgi:hypothetical protein